MARVGKVGWQQTRTYIKGGNSSDQCRTVLNGPSPRSIAHNQPQLHTHTYTMVAQVQKQAPTFKKTAVVDGVFDEVSLDKYKGKYVVLAFIPLAFTFVCPTEIIAFSEAAKKFEEQGAQVLSPPLTPNTPFGMDQYPKKGRWFGPNQHSIVG